MPLDALCLAAVREELSRQIVGARIDKIQQPERDVLVLALRGGDTSPCRLLISAGAGDARVHLTAQQFENPASPPMFCMLLRKHLMGARIVGIMQLPAERVLVITLSATDAIGDSSEKRLILELIGSTSNIILVGEDGIIIDSLRRIGDALSEKRAVLPGLMYRNPALQEGKRNPLALAKDEWAGLFGRQKAGEGLLDSSMSCTPMDGLNLEGNDLAFRGRGVGSGTVDKWLLSNFSGLSPLICRELSWRAYGNVDFRVDKISDGGQALRREFFSMMDAVNAGKFEPCLLTDAEGSSRDFSFTRIGQYEDAMNTVNAGSFSVLLDGHYTRSSQIERVRQRASATMKTVKNARDRVVRKLAVQHEELKKTAECDYLRECGDIIMANLFIMKKGQHEVTAQDFYSDDGAMRTIKLDPLKTPQQNAAKYYIKHKRAKSAAVNLSEQIELGGNELVYLESVLNAITYAEGESDLQDIRNELIFAGYLKPVKKTSAAKPKRVESAPMRFTSSTGMQILAGRNNMQNDKLTLKAASKSDTWLHAQKIHGSHVIITNTGLPPDERTLVEAASIASYYSSARASGKVPIDYTLVRNVKKPSGGRPGAVIYTNFKTVIGTPDEELVQRLRYNA